MLLFLAFVLNAEAGSWEGRGRLTTPDCAGKGAITIDSTTIEIETSGLFSKSSCTVKLNDGKALRVSQGLFNTTVWMTLKDGGDVRLKTSRKEYEPLKAALKSRIT